ncbi:CDP-2,3-bis-(O-geranylgeranyl)-sn-glycerol synthase [Candidatus Woesearchaeota archaeon]|nr:CDP-2,3-bis-(O-geranylgeranyl)-sn-glycerol synthase [Candidatus Woesearchaeota archaeon]
MLMFLLSVLYFMLPAYFANMAPVFVRKIKFLDSSIDFNKKYKGKPILGKHKTWRGLFFGVLFGIVVAYIQYLLYGYSSFSNISFVDYNNWFIIGFLLSFGALVGDSVKSFFKRRVGVKPGKPFIPWDQIDYAIGAIFFIYFVYALTVAQMIAILLISFFGHILINHLGYYLGIREVKW